VVGQEALKRVARLPTNISLWAAEPEDCDLVDSGTCKADGGRGFWAALLGRRRHVPTQDLVRRR
jgi:hypothetical protein